MDVQVAEDLWNVRFGEAAVPVDAVLDMYFSTNTALRDVVRCLKNAGILVYSAATGSYTLRSKNGNN